MRRREDRAITKHTLNLYAGDYERLQKIHGTRIGAAKVIRDLISVHLKRIENEAEQKVNTVEELDIEINNNEGVQQ